MPITNQQFVDSAKGLVTILENDITATKTRDPAAEFVYPIRCAHGVQNAMHELGKLLGDARKS